MSYLDTLTESHFRSLNSIQLDAILSSQECEKQYGSKWWFLSPEEELEKVAIENGWGNDWKNPSKSTYIPQSEFEKYRRLADSSLTSQAYAKYNLSVKSLGINRFGISYKDQEAGERDKNIRWLANEYNLNPEWITKTYLANLGLHTDAWCDEFESNDFKTVVKAINAIQKLLEDIDKKNEDEKIKKELETKREEENDRNLFKVDGVEIRVMEINGVKTINIIKADNYNIKIKDEYVFVHTKEELSAIPVQIRDQVKNCISNIELKNDQVTFDIKREKGKYECVTQSVIENENEDCINIFNWLMIKKELTNSKNEYFNNYVESKEEKDRILLIKQKAKSFGFNFYNNSYGGNIYRNGDYYCLSIPIKEFKIDKVKEFLTLWEGFNDNNTN